MPVGPNGEQLPYPGDPGYAGPQDPTGMAAAGPPASMPGGPPGGMEFPSTDPQALTAIAMQAIAQAAQMDQQQIDAMLQQVTQELGMRQQQAMTQVPDAIAAILARLAGPPPETMDDAAGTMPMPPEGMAPGPGPGEQAAMMGALG